MKIQFAMLVTDWLIYALLLMGIIAFLLCGGALTCVNRGDNWCDENQLWWR